MQNSSGRPSIYMKSYKANFFSSIIKYVNFSKNLTDIRAIFAAEICSFY